MLVKTHLLCVDAYKCFYYHTDKEVDHSTMLVVSVELWRIVLASSQETSLIMITTCIANAALEVKLTHCTGLDDLQLLVPLIPHQEEVSGKLDTYS